MSPTPVRAGSFQTCCQRSLLIVRITTLGIYIGFTANKVRVSFCNYKKWESFENFKLRVNVPFPSERREKLESLRQNECTHRYDYDTQPLMGLEPQPSNIGHPLAWSERAGCNQWS